jgi:hypothetical protein
MVDACAFASDTDQRLLLSNIDLGFPLPATDLQIGLNFTASSPELFAGKEMGEDALRLISDYRTRLAGIRSSVDSESKILRHALKWSRSLGIYKVSVKNFMRRSDLTPLASAWTPDLQIL